LIVLDETAIDESVSRHVIVYSCYWNY